MNTDARKVLLPIGDGSEEIESVTIADVLVRAGAHVTIASVMPSLEVTCSRGVKILADSLIGDCVSQTYDLVVCPGGLQGAHHLAQSGPLRDILQAQNAAQRPLAAICAAPAVVFAPIGLLDGKRATCYPAKKFQEVISHLEDDNVVVDGSVITSKGPATAMPFSLKLVELLYDSTMAEEVAGQLLYNRQHGFSV